MSDRGAILLPPASAALDAELRRVIKERGIVLWLDTDGSYNGFVEGLCERMERKTFPFPVLRFRGSFLELMLALEPYGNGLHPEKVLVHLPGFNKTTIAETPVYELYKAGRHFEKALDSLIEQASAPLVRPEQSAEFRKRKPTLEEADAWLTALQASEKNLFLLGLEQRDPASVLGELFTEESNLARDLVAEENTTQFKEYLERRFGLPVHPWVQLLRFSPETLSLAHLRTLLATWLMAVEFVTDLREPPLSHELDAIPSLPKSIVKLCQELVDALRQRSPEAYRHLSAEFEGSLGKDAQHSADKLGSIDTFRFEERAVRKAALDAWVAGNFDVALNYARERAPEKCFWVKQDKLLERTWQLILSGASVGRTLKQAAKGLKRSGSLDEAALRYRDTLFSVDQEHRQFEQLYHHLHSTELEDDVALANGRKAIQHAYREWADILTEQFCDLSAEFGPLPSPELRQRSIYEQFVHPLVQQGQRVALFMVDAMRFEMAQELRSFFDGKKYKTTLDVRLAELPTVTEVGMNALPPVSQQGRLRLVHEGNKIKGFRSGDSFTVSGWEQRIKAMQTKSLQGEAIELHLTEVVAASPAEVDKLLRRKNASKLIIVRSREFDEAGEHGFHLGTFEQTLNQLREAVQKLQAAGLGHFVMVADHGFLLQDQTAQQIEYANAPKRRHVLSASPSGKSDVLEIPLSALDYDSDAPAYLVFRRDTGVWRTQERLEPFVHGGNSLQERAIPVLCLEKHQKSGATAARYEVIAKALTAEGVKRQRLSLEVRLQRRSTGELSFAGPRKISLALRVVGREALPEILDVTPPGSLDKGVIYVPPGVEAATVTFGLEADSTVEEMVRVQVYHPDGTEHVEPADVEGWFATYPNRRARKQGGSGEYAAAPSERPVPVPTPVPPSGAGRPWQDSFEDEGFRKAFERIERQESINEVELGDVLGSTRKVRFFSRAFDDLRKLVPFEVEIAVVNGLKTYHKGSKR